jgi:hypothetical protein
MLWMMSGSPSPARSDTIPMCGRRLSIEAVKMSPGCQADAADGTASLALARSENVCKFATRL